MKLNRVIGVSILLLFLWCCPKPTDDIENDPYLTGTLSIVNRLSQDTLSIEPFEISNEHIINFSNIDPFIFDMSQTSQYSITKLEEYSPEFKWLFITILHENNGLYLTYPLYQIGGSGSTIGNTYGETKMWVYTSNGHYDGSINLQIIGNIYEGDTLFIDTLTVDFATNNIMLPDIQPNFVPSFIDTTESTEFKYILEFPDNFIIDSSEVELELLKEPILFGFTFHYEHTYGQLQIPTFINRQNYKLPYRAFKDSLYIFPITGLSK